MGVLPLLREHLLKEDLQGLLGIFRANQKPSSIQLQAFGEKASQAPKQR